MRNRENIRPPDDREVTSQEVKRARKALLRCSFCPPHRGENANSRSKWPSGKAKGWRGAKKPRKTGRRP
jgi:hypothetical protein